VEVTIEAKGLRIGTSETENTKYDFGGRDQDVDDTKRAITINGDVMDDVESFTYLFRSFLQRDGGVLVDVKRGITCGRVW